MMERMIFPVDGGKVVLGSFLPPKKKNSIDMVSYSLGGLQDGTSHEQYH